MRRLYLLFVLLFLPRSAAAGTCSRWVNNLLACEGIVDQAVCANQSQWNDGNWISYYNWIYSSDPDRACYKEVYKLHPGRKHLSLKVTNDWYNCYWDFDGDGIVSTSEMTQTISNITRDSNVQKDECCSYTPNGPYKAYDDGIRRKPGTQYDEAVRSEIRNFNMDKHNGQLKSDASAAGVADFTTELEYVWKAFDFAPDDPLPDDPYFLPPPGGDTAQVDHIIPRVDRKGCPCGDSGFANAQVISGQLNNAMGRSCNNPERKKFLDRWTIKPLAGTNTVEAEIEDDGGCNAAGGVGWIVALGIVGLRRRRNLRTRA